MIPIPSALHMLPHHPHLTNNNNHIRTPSSSSFFRRTMSGDHYGGDESQSASDQDELVGSTDLDDDELSDTEEIQFTYCNSTTSLHHHPADSLDNELCAGPDDCCCVANNSNNANSESSQHNDTAEHSECDRSTMVQLRIKLCCWAAALAATAFALLVWSPLYLLQLSSTSAGLGERPLNAFGALLFVTSLTTVGFFVATLIAATARKWDVKVYAMPLPWKR